jgi:hypothetical protein
MIKGNEDKFDDLEEFVDNLNRGGEIEFFYNKKKYSITHPESLIAFIEQENENSLKYFKDIETLLKHKIEGREIRNIVTEIQPFFRCF